MGTSRGTERVCVLVTRALSRSTPECARAVSLDGDVAVSSPLSALQRTKRGACVVEALLRLACAVAGPGLLIGRILRPPHSQWAGFLDA
ncbi:hypothetical protein SCP_0309860 [Sparassis crispa]|uniref:Uncharacterized protein n=1 Tax=Sparassis crispa TaxID=139825 RepID=A0A401GGF9_9APHY|nr:hypothetical protein SCP_0309790 [Sparassis crispa]XP_027612172.1 hypothetical protein SCP_0309860 [Sparassis crispa]GBE81252.1 hypothetical protein SCP_0309790 [Sparassis crispa]GBE81259.1 hypothetical protein SCP_0309860 [Sparassis crispa]